MPPPVSWRKRGGYLLIYSAEHTQTCLSAELSGVTHSDTADEWMRPVDTVKVTEVGRLVVRLVAQAWLFA